MTVVELNKAHFTLEWVKEYLDYDSGVIWIIILCNNVNFNRRFSKILFWITFCLKFLSTTFNKVHFYILNQLNLVSSYFYHLFDVETG